MAAADWSQQLPNDLLSFIGNKLDVVADRCRFRSVCKSWRCSLPPFAQPPFLMLSLSQQPPPELPKEIVYEDEEEDENEEEEEEDDDEEEEEKPPSPSLCLRGFVGIGGGANERNMVYEIELPEAHLRRCVGSTGNWLITVDKSGRIYLLNPFSKVQFDLPRQSKFEYGYQKGDKKLMTLEQYRDCLLRKVILSSSTPSSITNKNCIAMAIHHYKYKLAIARPGDTSWTTVDSPNRIFFEDIIIYKQQFYAVDRVGRVMVCDIDIADNNALLHTPKTSVVMESLLEELPFHKLYLVEWCGQLLLVIKFLQNLRMNEEGIKQKQLPMYKTEKFKIYKLDFVYKKWEELNSLGKYCLFLGYNTSVSVETCKYSESLERNCIYFTDDFTYGYRGTETPGGLDMGVFNLDDKSIRAHYEGVSTFITHLRFGLSQLNRFTYLAIQLTKEKLVRCLRKISTFLKKGSSHGHNGYHNYPFPVDRLHDNKSLLDGKALQNDSLTSEKSNYLGNDLPIDIIINILNRLNIEMRLCQPCFLKS